MSFVGEDREWANSTPSAGRGGSGSGRGAPSRSSAGRGPGAGPGRGGTHQIQASYFHIHIHQLFFLRLVCTKSFIKLFVQTLLLAHQYSLKNASLVSDCLLSFSITFYYLPSGAGRGAGRGGSVLRRPVSK